MKAKILSSIGVLIIFFQLNIPAVFALVEIDAKGNVFIQSQGQVLGQTEIDLEKLSYEQFLEFYNQIELDSEASFADTDPEKMYQAFLRYKDQIQVFQRNDGSVETRIVDPESEVTSVAFIKGNQIESRLVMPDGSFESTQYQIGDDSKVEPVKIIQVKPVDNKMLEISGNAQNGVVPKLKDDQVRITGEQNQEVVIVTNDQNQLVFAQGLYGVATDYQVSIDSTDNNLIIQTPSNYLKVKALPGSVVSALKVSGEIDSVVSNKTSSESFDFLSTDTHLLDLTETNNDLWYQVNGVKRVKILGLIPTQVDKKISVSIKTGQIEKIEQNLKDKIISMFSV